LSELPWWKSGVIYQIYPRSFADSNGDGIGDLAGITSRLDYLADLPVDAIWLSPFYPSPMADFGYDVADYCDVHPLFGTMADFDALVEGAHARGIKVVVDWVPCHTSDQHEWFAESRSSRDNAKRDWYVWRDAKPDGSPPNNWLSCFERIGQAWTLDPQTGQYYLHSFMPEQPDLNWENQEVRAAMYDTLRFWLDRDVDGFRIDVTHRLGKDPELRDNPYQVIADTRKVLAALKRGDMVDADQRMDENWPSTHERLREIRAVVDEYDDRAIVGEVYLLNQRELCSTSTAATSCTSRTTSRSSTSRGAPPTSVRWSTSGTCSPASWPGRTGSSRTTTIRGSPAATTPAATARRARGSRR
jgi:alpha-glucosidase